MLIPIDIVSSGLNPARALYKQQFEIGRRSFHVFHTCQVKVFRL